MFLGHVVPFHRSEEQMYMNSAVLHLVENAAPLVVFNNLTYNIA